MPECRLNRCYYFMQKSSNSAFLWVLSSSFALLELFTSSLLGPWRIHLTKSLDPLIALSFDHQNHKKCPKWGHVCYSDQPQEETTVEALQAPTLQGCNPNHFCIHHQQVPANTTQEHWDDEREERDRRIRGLVGGWTLEGGLTAKENNKVQLHLYPFLKMKN